MEYILRLCAKCVHVTQVECQVSVLWTSKQLLVIFKRIPPGYQNKAIEKVIITKGLLFSIRFHPEKQLWKELYSRMRSKDPNLVINIY